MAKIKLEKLQEKIRRQTSRVGDKLSSTPGALAAGAVGVTVAAVLGVAAARRVKNDAITAIHVVPNGNSGWAIKADAEDRELGTQRRQRDAVSEGRVLARERRPSILVVHRTDGRVGRTYRYPAEGEGS